MIEQLILASAAAYISTAIISISSLFEPFRNWFKVKTAGTIFDKKPKHFIECRLCMSFWTSLLFSIVYFSSIYYTLPIYGISYFMATQER